VPNYTVNNLKLLDRVTGEDKGEGFTFKIMQYPAEPHMHLPETKHTSPFVNNYLTTGVGLWEQQTDTLRNDNPTTPPEFIKVTGNDSGYRFSLPASDDPDYFFANTKFIYGEGEEDFYLGTNHKDTENFFFE
jgi:hypothetical protein